MTSEYGLFNSGNPELDAENEAAAAKWTKTLRRTPEGPDPLDLGDNPEAEAACDALYEELRSRAEKKFGTGETSTIPTGYLGLGINTFLNIVEVVGLMGLPAQLLIGSTLPGTELGQI